MAPSATVARGWEGCAHAIDRGASPRESNLSARASKPVGSLHASSPDRGQCPVCAASLLSPARFSTSPRSRHQRISCVCRSDCALAPRLNRGLPVEKVRTRHPFGPRMRALSSILLPPAPNSRRGGRGSTTFESDERAALLRFDPRSVPLNFYLLPPHAHHDRALPAAAGTLRSRPRLQIPHTRRACEADGCWHRSRRYSGSVSAETAVSIDATHSSSI